MDALSFIHPSDAAALKSLTAVPGLNAIMKKFMSIGYEKMLYGEFLAQTIRLSPNQLPRIYNHLPPICERLGIQVPELFLLQQPDPNAFTYGDTKIFITVTSGLVEMASDEELDAVLAHECGHILCHHVLYHSLTRFLLSTLETGILGDVAALVSGPLKYALLYWERMSELSADRVAAVVTSPDTVIKVMCRLSGGSNNIIQGINYDEWIKQADDYDRLKKDSRWDKILQGYLTLGATHPFSAVRVREIHSWGKTDEYDRAIHTPASDFQSNQQVCPKCGSYLEDGWKFCLKCGRPVDNAQTIKCPSCGSDIRKDSRFCPECGAKIN